MADRAAIIERLKVLMAEDTDVNVEQVTEESNIREGLGLDSVDLVGVVMKIEGAYRIRLTHQDLQNVVTVRELIDLIIAKQASQQAA